MCRSRVCRVHGILGVAGVGVASYHSRKVVYLRQKPFFIPYILSSIARDLARSWR